MSMSVFYCRCNARLVGAEARFNHVCPPRPDLDPVSFVLKAMRVIAELPEQDGTIECPKCSAPLRFAKAPGNGHICAACSTPDCLRFMQ